MISPGPTNVRRRSIENFSSSSRPYVRIPRSTRNAASANGRRGRLGGRLRRQKDRSRTAQERGERPAIDGTVVWQNPRLAVPISIIVDDSTCLVNLNRFAIPQFAAAQGNRPLRSGLARDASGNPGCVCAEIRRLGRRTRSAGEMVGRAVSGLHGIASTGRCPVGRGRK